MKETSEIENLKKEIVQIKSRNYRVEADKAWEVSEFRIFTLATTTFIFVSLVFYLIGVKYYILSAFISAVCYFLSMQSLPFIKRWWVKKYLRQK